MLRKKLILATHNLHKQKEMNSILSPLGILIVGLDEFSHIGDIEETGTTLLENAYIKARTVYKLTGLPSIADDTGLEVDSLNGAPGVYSARYAGNRSNSKDNIDLVLKKMKNSKNRNAHFRTIITLYLDSKVYFFDGSVSGTISYKPIGNFGFGYDSIFIPQGYDITFAQMNAEAKNKISHRKKAIEKLNTFLLNK